jgi:hypothetical protein
MANKSFEPTDPMALVGVDLGGGPDDGALEEMAWCFVDEYIRMGWSGERILRVFRNPFYRGPHQILSVKGEEFVRGLIEKAEGVRDQIRSRMGDRTWIG